MRKRPLELGSPTSDAGSAADAAGVTSAAGGGAYTAKYARIESTVLQFASGFPAYKGAVVFGFLKYRAKLSTDLGG